jgi:hypothetical protein
MADTPETTDAGAETAAKPAKSRKKAALKVVETVAAEAAETVAAVETAASGAASAASTRFGKAIEDAKASAATLKGDALEKTAALTETVTNTASELGEKATVYAEQAKVVALDLARQGKTKATDALSAVGETIESNAGVIDEKLGVQYGDYARGAAHTLQSTAASLEAKDIPEIGEEIAGFVRKSPVKAIGIAAAAGFQLSRLYRRSAPSKDAAIDTTDA